MEGLQDPGILPWYSMGPKGRAGKGDFAGALSSHSSEKQVCWVTLKPEMFMAALIIITKTQRQPRRPSVGEWINKLWYIRQSMYSLLKRNELSNYEKT